MCIVYFVISNNISTGETPGGDDHWVEILLTTDYLKNIIIILKQSIVALVFEDKLQSMF